MNFAIDSTLEQQYNNRAAVTDYADYLNRWAECSEDYRSRGKAYLDIVYGASPRQLLDIFPVQDSQSAPVHVFIHGGYWQALDKNSFSHVAEAFNRQGECAVMVNYDLCPSVSIEQIITQIRSAVTWVHRHIQQYGGDPGQIQLSGHSAGAHLLACMLTQDWSQSGLYEYPFQLLNGLSGLYDLQPLMATSVNQALGLNRQSAKHCSPLFARPWKPSKTIKLKLMVGELESDEYKKQSTRLIEHWDQCVDISYQLLDRRHHFSMLDTFIASALWKSS